MKTLQKIICIAALIATPLVSQALPPTALFDGTLYTNATVVVGGNTNQVGVVLAASTNTFNFPAASSWNASGVTVGSQLNTNQWPSAAFQSYGYPQTIYGPFQTAEIYISLPNTAGTADTHVVTFNGTPDGVKVLTNLYSFTVTAGTPLYTNINIGALYGLAVNTIANTNAAAAVTNGVIIVGGKNEL